MFHKFLSLLLITATSVAQVRAAPSILDRKLPDVLQFSSGKKIANSEDWMKRRLEILELFRTNMYGRSPIFLERQLTFKVKHTTLKALDGKATLKEVIIILKGLTSSVQINVSLFIPNNGSESYPLFLLICNRNKSNIDPTRKIKSEFWPVEKIIARGYATAAFHYADVAPDNQSIFRNGVIKSFRLEEKADSWGAIAAWAWGASRVLDYLNTEPRIDTKRVAVIGHSRGGKTALWAGAEDTRFAMAVSNNSGCGGAALSRSKAGETIGFLYSKQPHWFCQNFKQYKNKENLLPFDQHQLIALMAPRLVYISSASEDEWADPYSEFLAGIAASPVYSLFNQVGLNRKSFPKPNSVIHEGSIGYHLRFGKHDLTAWDWEKFMNFADLKIRLIKVRR